MKLTHVAVALLPLTMGSCTLFKPVVGLFTGPFYVLSEGGGSVLEGTLRVGNCRGEGAAVAAGAVGAVIISAGPIGGLITGIISDWNYLTGRVSREQWMNNFHNPFMTNTQD